MSSAWLAFSTRMLAATSWMREVTSLFDWRESHDNRWMRGVHHTTTRKIGTAARVKMVPRTGLKNQMMTNAPSIPAPCSRGSRMMVAMMLLIMRLSWNTR